MNEMSVSFSSISENVSFARVTVGAFIAQLDPTMDELTEIKTVVSEVVTNSIIHGYNNEPNHYILIHCKITDGEIKLTIKDSGVDISDLAEAREPLFSSVPQLYRDVRGCTIIENFMDTVEIRSEIDTGTTLKIDNRLIKSKSASNEACVWIEV